MTPVYSDCAICGDRIREDDLGWFHIDGETFHSAVPRPTHTIKPRLTLIRGGLTEET